MRSLSRAAILSDDDPGRYRAPALTGAAAKQQTTAPYRRSGWRSTLSDPAIAAIAVYALVAMGAAVAAYLSVFTVWGGYDDEGTVLVTLKAFAQGETLYRDIYSPYGPFYFELFGGWFALSGQAVSTDVSRSIVIVLWLATSLLSGLVTQHLTGRLMLGVTGMIAAFASLFVLVNEPMHPQVLCVFLLGAFVLLAVLGPTGRPLWAGSAAGAVLAALLLTKLNLGVYAIAAVVLAAALTVEPLRRRRWLSRSAIAAVIALPILVAGRDLDLAWVRDLVSVEVLAMAAIAIAAWPLGLRRDEDDDSSSKWLLGACLGFAAAFVAIMGAIALNGSSPSEVYDGVVTEAMRVRDVLLTQFTMSPSVVDWAVASVAGAALYVGLRSRGGDWQPTIWPGLLRAVAGLAIWMTVARIVPISLNPAAGNPDSLPAVLAWIAVIPPAGVEEAPYKRFVRVLLPALGVAEALQVYPVAGSQVGIASFTFVPVGALLLADALTSLRAWSASRGALALERFGVVIAVALVALAADFAINTILRSAGSNLTVYRDQQAVPFPGATQIRMPPGDAENYIGLVDLLRRYRCTDFIGYPNVNSLYLWSGIDPPRPYAPGAWIEALDSKRQQRIVNQLRASPRPCAIRNDGLAAFWLGEDPVPDRPLVNYVLNDFRTVDEVGEFQFMLPR
jgi:hypothetical protein